MRKKMDLEFFSDPLRYAKLVNKPYFKTLIMYNESLCAIHLNKNLHNFNKPIYVGLAVLDITKTLIYNFH